MKYKFEVTEILSKIVEVDADSAGEAHDMVWDDYKSENIILDASNITLVDIQRARDNAWVS